MVVADITGTIVSLPNTHPQDLKFDNIPSRFEKECVSSSCSPASFALEMATGKAMEVTHQMCWVGFPAKEPPT